MEKINKTQRLPSAEGECPNCGLANLQYFKEEIEKNIVKYPFQCRGCGCRGKEIFAPNYIRTEINPAMTFSDEESIFIAKPQSSE